MKKFFSMISRICVAVFLLSVAFIPAKTFAADMESEGVKAYREALSSYSEESESIFRQDILFTSPLMQGELDILCTTENDMFKATGDFSLWIYNDDGTITENIIPYYMEQNGKDMTIYFKSGKQWQKFVTPSLAASIMDMVATPTSEEVEELIADTKDVTILRENENRRTMLITLDGNRMADSLKAKSDENPDANQEDTVNYLDTALRNANVWYMWTIDKRDWRTITMQYHLSGIVQELARAALNDPNKQWPDEFSQLLETIAYYSEIRAYTTYPTDPKAKKQFQIPKNVLKAKSVDNLISLDVTMK